MNVLTEESTTKENYDIDIFERIALILIEKLAEKTPEQVHFYIIARYIYLHPLALNRILYNTNSIVLHASCFR